MGLGDDMMYLADAHQIHSETGKTIRPTRRNKPVNLSKKELWSQETFIKSNGEYDFDELIPHKNDWLRPYAVGNRDYKPHAIPITLTPEELQLTYKLREQAPYVVLSVDSKETTHAVNKTWPKEYWDSLAELLPLKCIRLHNPHSTDYNYKHISSVKVNSARESYCYIRSAALVITTDGFAHHASASANTKCCVIWTVTHQKQLGYPGQLNILDAQHSGCYTYRQQCDECVEANKRITPAKVYNELQKHGWL